MARGRLRRGYSGDLICSIFPQGAARLAGFFILLFFSACYPATQGAPRRMKPRARGLALSVPAVAASADPHGRSDLCLLPPIPSPPSPYRPPDPDAAIRLGPKFQVSTVPAYQGSSCTGACERGDRLVSVAEVELALARTTACRMTAAAFHEPGVRLELAKGEWLSAPRRRRQQPRCRTFGCSLPDLHAGLHQVAQAPFTSHPRKRPDRATPLAGGEPGLQAAGGAQTLGRRGGGEGREGGGLRLASAGVHGLPDGGRLVR